MKNNGINKKDFLNKILDDEREKILAKLIEKEKKGKYHKSLKSILNEFNKENKKLIFVKPPIKINDLKPKSKSVVEYSPDYILKFKTGEKSFEHIIFEFLDKQLDIKTMADISRCVLINNCRMLFLLSKTASKHEETKRIRDVFIDGFDKLKRGENREDKSKSLIAVTLHIPPYLSKKKVKENILKEIKKEVRRSLILWQFSQI